MTMRESILMTLYKIISELEQADVRVFRNLGKPLKLNSNGVIILRDGEAAKTVDVILSPITYIYELGVTLEVMVQHPEPEIRCYTLDSLLVEIGKILAEDPTVDGLAEHLQIEPPEFQEEAIEGGATVRSAIVLISIRFATDNVLG